MIVGGGERQGGTGAIVDLILRDWKLIAYELEEIAITSMNMVITKKKRRDLKLKIKGQVYF